jgi:pyrimidine operon attenuation protein/uracil phosphoribosyltransferase
MLGSLVVFRVVARMLFNISMLHQLCSLNVQDFGRPRLEKHASASSQTSDKPLPQPVDDIDAILRSNDVHPDEHPHVYFKLPDDIADRHVLVMDPILSSGYTVVRAIEKLLVRLPARIVLPVLVA